MMAGYSKRISRVLVGLLGLVMVMMLVLVCGTGAQAATKKKKKKVKTVKVTISGAGDCTLGVDPRLNNTFNSYFNVHGASYFLKNVQSRFGNDDITIVNFEGTLTQSTARANKQYTFKGPASHVNILKKGSVEVVTLANNHSMDWGTQGMNDTTTTLVQNGIQFCYYDSIAYKKVRGVKVAMIGVSQLDGVSNARLLALINKAKANKAKIIVINIHWGEERVYTPTMRQIAMGHFAIDNGATLVLGHHPHVLQGVEKYKNKFIVYSLGNFCFGGNVNPSDKDTMIYQQTFYVKGGKLQSKIDAKIVPCSLSGVTYTNDFQPRILEKNEKWNLIVKMRGLSAGMNTYITKYGRLK